MQAGCRIAHYTDGVAMNVISDKSMEMEGSIKILPMSNVLRLSFLEKEKTGVG